MDRFINLPFTILIDSAESRPYSFRGIKADANQGYGTFVPRLEVRSLGRHPKSYGDYSLVDGFPHCVVERKSQQDAWGTICGWPTGHERDRGLPGRRDRFERELENMNRDSKNSLIVVECSLNALLVDCPQWGAKPAHVNAKIISRSINSFQQRFPRVQWAFAADRRHGEVITFRWLWRYWKENLK